MKLRYKHQNVSNLGGWCKNDRPIDIVIDNTYNVFRPYQIRINKEGIEALENGLNVVVNAPPAAGKSQMSDCIIYDQQIKNPLLRSIQSVPQTIIGDGFAEEHFIHPITGEKVDYTPLHNFCKYNGNINAKIQEITEILSASPSGTIEGRQIICSHSVLTSLIDAFDKGEIPERVFQNILINPDESHHLSWGEDEEGNEHTNKLGRICQLSHQRRDLNLKILLSTASFFRSNRLPIVLEDILKEQFRTLKVAWDEFLPYTGINQFSMDFWLYENGLYINPLKELFQVSKKPTIVYIDPGAGGEEKAEYIKNVFKASSGGNRPNIKYDTKTGLTYVNGEPVMDLVVVRGSKDMEAKLETLFANHKSEKPLFNLMIALHRAKEGYNNRHLQRTILINPRSSMVDNIQIPGRLFRAAPGKDMVEIHTLMGYNSDYDSEEYRENINEYTNAVFGCMLLEQVMAPKLISLPAEKKQSYLDEAFPSEYDKQDAIQEALEIIIMDAKKSDVVSVNQVKEQLKEFLLERNVKEENVDNVNNELIAIIQRHCASMGEVEDKDKSKPKLLKVPEFLDIHLWKQDLIGDPTINIGKIKAGYGGLFGNHSLKALREIIDASRVKWELAIELLKKYKEEHGDIDVPYDYVVEIEE